MDPEEITEEIRDEFGESLFQHFMTTPSQALSLEEEFSVEMVDQLWLNYRINHPSDDFDPISKEALERFKNLEFNPELSEKSKCIFDQFVKGKNKFMVIATGIPNDGCFMIWKRGREFLIVGESNDFGDSIAEIFSLKNLQVSSRLAYVI